jgi:hypothetical protein
MANAHQIRELITETTTGSVRPRVPREVRDEVCRLTIDPAPSHHPRRECKAHGV